MCGICGYVTYTSNIKDKIGVLQKMCDVLYHRGPDEGDIIFLRTLHWDIEGSVSSI